MSEDNYTIERKKKKDKAKENFDKNGKFTQKNIRIKEALLEKNKGKKN
jgi:hypothetical protein